MKYILKEEQKERNLTAGDQRLIQLLKDIKKDGGLTSIYKIFQDPKIFIQALYRRDLLDYVDPFDWPWEALSNEIFYYNMNKDPNFYKKIIDRYFSSSIQKIGNDYYVILNYSDILRFFQRSKTIDDEFVSAILSGDFSDLDYFEYDISGYDVYSELNHGEIIVKDKIKLELESRSHLDVTSITPELFDEIMYEQGNEGEIEMTDSAIEKILNDEESIEYLIKNDLEDIESNLRRLGQDCENSMVYKRYRKKLYKLLMDSNIIDDDQVIRIPRPPKFDANFYIEAFKVTKSIEKQIRKHLQMSQLKSKETLFDIGGYRYLVIENLEDTGYLELPNFDDQPEYKDVLSCIEQNVKYYL